MRHDGRGRAVGAAASDGTSVSYAHNASGQLTGVSSHGGRPVSFAYGPGPRLVAMGDSRSDIAKMTYDDSGRVLTHWTPHGTWRYVYDDGVRRMLATGPDSKATSYYHDAMGRLVAYGPSKTNMTLFNHDRSGRILQVAQAVLLNEPMAGQPPKFRTSGKILPMPSDGPKGGKR